MKTKTSIKSKKDDSKYDLLVLIILIVIVIISRIPDINYGAQISGDKVWPCIGYYTISSNYGRRNTGIPGATTNHKGIDISCPTGTKIVSVLDGKVQYTGYNTYRGYYVTIEHANGIVTRYQHGSPYSFKVKEGDKVKAGQTIMLSGSTGVSSGPHLHFEVLVNGKNVNPKKWLKQ